VPKKRKNAPKRKKPAKPRLTPDEERFVEEYLIDRNGTAAYIRVHPGAKRSTAGTESYRLLKKPQIAKEVKAASRELRRACKTSAAAEVRKLALLANYDIGGAFDLTADGWVILPPRLIPYEVRQAIVGVKFKKRYERGADGKPELVEDVEYKFADKLAARDKLMRHLGLYNDLPPLEVLLAALPPDLAEAVRTALAAKVHAGGSDQDAQPPGNSGGSGATTPGNSTLDQRPDPRVPQGAPGAGPVAGAVPGGPVGPADAPVLPPLGQDDGRGGEDAGPLFDPPEGAGDGVQPDA
jgi:phage terminase small subunit